MTFSDTLKGTKEGVEQSMKLMIRGLTEVIGDEKKSADGGN